MPDLYLFGGPIGAGKTIHGIVSKMPREISEDLIVQVGQAAVDEAIETHRRMGRYVVGWEDGLVRWIRPEEIEPRPLPGDDWQPPQTNRTYSAL
jgi:hypothetical protein